MPTTKRCSACKTDHPTTDFGKDRSRHDGLSHRCLHTDRARRRIHGNTTSRTVLGPWDARNAETMGIEVERYIERKAAGEVWCRCCNTLHQKSLFGNTVALRAGRCKAGERERGIMRKAARSKQSETVLASVRTMLSSNIDRDRVIRYIDRFTKKTVIEPRHRSHKTP